MRWFGLLPVAVLIISCSSVSLKNVEIRKADGSVLKIESLEAFNISELELMRILSDTE